MDAIDLPGQVPNWHVRFGSHSTKVLPLTKEWTICGRHPACDVVFDNNAVGRRHFAVVLRRGGCYVHDLSSRCGTMLHRGTGVGGLRADCEIRPGCWQVVGLTPLRAGDEFGHPAGWLTLEQAVPMSTDDWVTGNNSQSMLLAIRNSPFAGPDRLRLFLDRCFGLLNLQHRDEAVHRRLREHADTWSAAAGLARFVVAMASSDQGSRRDTELDATELALCQLMRECFDNPLPDASSNALCSTIVSTGKSIRKACLKRLLGDLPWDSFEIRAVCTVFGRHPVCDIQLDNNVAGRCVQIVLREGRYFLEDIYKGHNATVNGVKLLDERGKIVLKHGDQIRINRFVFQFVVEN